MNKKTEPERGEITNYELKITNYQLQIGNYELRIKNDGDYFNKVIQLNR